MSVWPFVPQRGMTETSEWKTEVLRSRSAEQRIALRNIPRTTIELNFQLLPQEIEAATTLARDYGADEFLLPFWQDLDNVGTVSSSTTSISIATANRRYKVGGSAFIMGSNGSYETVTIAAIASDSITLASPGVVLGYVGAVIMPAYTARVRKPFSFAKRSANYVTGNVTCILTEDFDITSANPYPSYDGDYVLTDRPLLDGANETHTREFEGFANIAGPLYYSKTYTYPTSTSMLAWSFNNATELMAFRKWMYVFKGKLGSFYAPRWTYDFVIGASASTAEEFLVVQENAMLQDTYLGKICVVLNDGTQLYYEVESWESHLTGLYKMNLTTTVGQDIDASDVQLICRMPKMRFNSDNVEFDYTDGSVVNVRLPMMEVPD